jgi:hypothetical protein
MHELTFTTKAFGQGISSNTVCDLITTAWMPSRMTGGISQQSKSARPELDRAQQQARQRWVAAWRPNRLSKFGWDYFRRRVFSNWTGQNVRLSDGLVMNCQCRGITDENILISCEWIPLMSRTFHTNDKEGPRGRVAQAHDHEGWKISNLSWIS